MFEDGVPFLDITPYSFFNVDRCFRGAYCLHHQGDIFDPLDIQVSYVIPLINYTHA
jgi:hypothetical protein